MAKKMAAKSEKSVRPISVAQNEVCVLLSKLFASKAGGGVLGEEAKNLPPGEYEVEALLKVVISATVGEPFAQATYRSVPLIQVLNLAQMMSGAVRPHLERAAQVVRALVKMESQGRKRFSAVHYVDGDGREQEITAQEIADAKAMLDDKQRLSTLIPLSEQIQTGVEFRGKTTIHSANVQVARLE